MRDEDEIRKRIEVLEARYDENDPPLSPIEDELEVELLRAIAELEWALGDREDPEPFPSED